MNYIDGLSLLKQIILHFVIEITKFKQALILKHFFQCFLMNSYL